MHKKLQYHYDRLEQDRRVLGSMLEGYPDERLNATDGKRWSVNQILIHLLTAEESTLTYLKKKSLGVDTLENSGLQHTLKSIALALSQRLPLRYRAPEKLVANTPPAMPWKELTSRWDASRGELSGFLDGIHEKNLHKLIYKHPVAGRFDVVQCLAFMREHFQHHLPQIKRQLQ